MLKMFTENVILWSQNVVSWAPPNSITGEQFFSNPREPYWLSSLYQEPSSTYCFYGLRDMFTSDPSEITNVLRMPANPIIVSLTNPIILEKSIL